MLARRPSQSTADLSRQRGRAPLIMVLGIAALTFALSSAGGCIMIDPEGPTDADGKPIPLPAAGDNWLLLESVNPEPGNIEARPTFIFTFSDYLDPGSFLTYGFASLRSGGIQIGGIASYRMVDKSVVWRPSSGLEEALNYQLKLDSALTSATDAPFWPLSSPREPLAGYLYATGLEVEEGANNEPKAEDPDKDESPEAPLDPPVDAPLPDAKWGDVAPIIEASCASCHHDPDWGLNPLGYEDLVGKPSAQVERLLVRPADPANSYLMQKLLWDYADIKFSPQPPPWSEGAAPLERPELLTIEGWIARGARR